jgi:hypothetical protein
MFSWLQVGANWSHEKLPLWNPAHPHHHPRGDFELALLAGLPVARCRRLAGSEVDEGGCASDPRRQDPRRKRKNLT